MISNLLTNFKEIVNNLSKSSDFCFLPFGLDINIIILFFSKIVYWYEPFKNPDISNGKEFINLYKYIIETNLLIKMKSLEEQETRKSKGDTQNNDEELKNQFENFITENEQFVFSLQKNELPKGALNPKDAKEKFKEKKNDILTFVEETKNDINIGPMIQNLYSLFLSIPDEFNFDDLNPCYKV